MFTPEDFETLSDMVASAWRSGRDRDWTARAGTLEWSCTHTADHAVDTVLAPAFFLASRCQDHYPRLGGQPFTVGADATPDELVEALETAARVLLAVIAAADPSVRAIIRRRPAPQAAGPEDFAPRAGLELILHAHDVCAGLGVPFEPPPPLCRRLREHTRGWPMWWGVDNELQATTDPWADMLRGTQRQRFSCS